MTLAALLLAATAAVAADRDEVQAPRAPDEIQAPLGSSGVEVPLVG